MDTSAKLLIEQDTILYIDFKATATAIYVAFVCPKNKK